MNASCSWDASPELRVYTDADFAACPYTSRSASGIVVHIGTGQFAFPVMWQSRKQTSVARSTPEAEMISMASALFSEVINLQTFLQSASKSTVPIIFFQDNETVVAILKSGYSPKLRHLGRVHRVNVASTAEIFEQEDFSATYVNSKDQLANGLTKVIPPAEWPEMLTQLCLSEGVPHTATVSKVVVEKDHMQEDLVQLMTFLPGESAVRRPADEASCFTTCAFAHGGGIAGLRQNVTLFPIVISVLCRFIRRVLPKHKFTAVMSARNQITLTRRGSFNEPCSRNAAIPLEVFEGGHWVQSHDLSRGECGEVLGWPAIFDPRRLHATAPCTRGTRTVAIAFTPRNVSRLSVEDQLKLRTLGFHFGKEWNTSPSS